MTPRTPAGEPLRNVPVILIGPRHSPFSPWLGRGPALQAPSKPKAGPCFDPASRCRFPADPPKAARRRKAVGRPDPSISDGLRKVLRHCGTVLPARSTGLGPLELPFRV
jgi:hypothetical protein